MPERSRFYWDACVMLSYVNQEASRMPNLDAFLAQARRTEIEILTSVLSVAEVAFSVTEQTGRVLDPDEQAKIDTLWDYNGGPIKLVDFHLLVAEKARDIRRDGMVAGLGGLKSVDVMHLATAVRENVTEIHTYEPAWKNWSVLVGIPIREPEPDQPMLSLLP